jgi:hypothetical protein
MLQNLPSKVQEIAFEKLPSRQSDVETTSEDVVESTSKKG